jgi:hypothetical protein
VLPYELHTLVGAMRTIARFVLMGFLSSSVFERKVNPFRVEFAAPSASGRRMQAAG